MRGALGYVDENEKPMHQEESKRMELQSWAAGKPSFTAEVDRIVTYISKPQTSCYEALREPEGDWLLCMEDWRLPTGKTGCVAYSFSMDNGDAEFLKTVIDLGCEVHKFDPSRSTSSGGDKDHVLGGVYSNIDVVRHHRAWPEWRPPKKRKQKKKASLGSGPKTLADIMEILGHQRIDFLYADLLSAEWRVLQNWAELGIIRSVGNLIATVHMQWAGFEVPGTNEEVVRYWFSVLQGIHAAGFQLVHCSAQEKENRVLKQTVTNAHGSYTLSWINTRH
ncbi:putative methyltransferase-like protein 24 [Aplochiton taeniatus]